MLDVDRPDSAIFPGRPLRVAMIAFSPNHHTFRWARALSDAGLDIRLIGVSAADADSPHPPHGAKRHRLHSIPVVSAAWGWHAAIAAANPDVVYMQWLFARPAMLLALNPRWPMIATVMGSDVRQDLALPETMLERVWRTTLLLRAQHITTVAAPLAQIVAGYHVDLGGRMSIVPFGVDTTQFFPAVDRPMRQPREVLVIGHFKSDDVTYGRMELLQASMVVMATGQKVQLHLAGRRGNDGGAVTAYLASHPELAAHVIDHGSREVDMMPPLYRKLDVYVMNSMQESFGVAAAEALATGVPVIASDVGGVRSLVRSGDTGLLVPTADVPALAEALLEIAQYPAFAYSAGQRGRARVQAKFEWQTTVDTMVKLIRQAARRKADH